MPDYPDSIYSPRTLVNWYKRTFDALKTRTFYAEDYNNAVAEIVAIETELGLDVAGAYADLTARLSDLADQNLKTTDAPTFAYGTEITDGSAFLQFNEYILLNTYYAGLGISMFDSELKAVGVNNTVFLYAEDVGQVPSIVLGSVDNDTLFFFQCYPLYNAFQFLSADSLGNPQPIDNFSIIADDLVLWGNDPNFTFSDWMSTASCRVQYLASITHELSFYGADGYVFDNLLKITNMPTTDPSDATNTIWYDPTDGNRLKMGT